MKYGLEVIGTIAAATVVSGCTGGRTGKEVPLAKPNILWITIEDTSPQFIGCYGNTNARTPVIDSLAAGGVRFVNAFSTGTVSSPSRSCLITGVKTYMSGTGNHRSNYPLPEYIKGYPWYMKRAGYYTTNNSKTDYNVANADAFTKEAWDESSVNAGWWNRKPGQPFFAVFNYNESHQSRTMTQPYDWYVENVLSKIPEGRRTADDEFEMPPVYNDSPAMRKQFARVYNSITLTDIRIGELLARLEKDHLTDSTIIFFYADHGEGVPRGKTNGINFGYRVPFIIWFPEMYKDLSPWGTGGVVSGELVDFEDLAPTVISLTGADVPEHMKGRILMGKERSETADHLILSADRSDNGPDLVRSATDGRFVYSRNFMPFMPELRYIRYMEIGEIKQQMRKELSEDQLGPLQKSLFDARPPEFLFDIESDIWETKNLVNDPSYADVLDRMRKLVEQEILQARDILLLPEYEIGLLSATATPYEFRMSDENFPVGEIYRAASLSGFRGSDYTAKQAEFLNDPNKIVRYWAILGLRSQVKADLEPYMNRILEAIGDDYPPVAITAAAIAWQLYGDIKAQETLTRYAADNNLDLSLMAINYLLYVDNKQPFIETIKKVHGMDNRNYNVRAACLDFLGSLGIVPNTFDFQEYDRTGKYF